MYMRYKNKHLLMCQYYNAQAKQLLDKIYKQMSLLHDHNRVIYGLPLLLK